MKKNIKYNCKDCGVEVETRVIGEGFAYWERKCPYCYSQSLINKTNPEKPKDATFTQGEWQADSATVYALNSNGVNIFYAGFQSGNTDNGERTKEDVLIANAKLASAAPDMYKALKSVGAIYAEACAVCNPDTIIRLSDIMVKINYAIAKANGEEMK